MQHLFLQNYLPNHQYKCFLCITNMSQDIPRVSFYYTSTYNTCPLYIHVTPCNALVHVIYSMISGQWFRTIPHITYYIRRVLNERVNCVLLFNTFCLTEIRCKLIMGITFTGLSWQCISGINANSEIY